MNDPRDAQRRLDEVRRLRAEGSISASEAYARHLSITEAPVAVNEVRATDGSPVSASGPPPPPTPGISPRMFSFDGDDGVNGRILYHGPERLSRLLLFFKFLFVVPLLVWLAVYRAAALVVVFLAFWAILFSGRFPPGLFGFVRGYVNSQYRVYSYFPLLLSDDWTAGENHSLKFLIEPSPRQSRLLLIFTKLPAMVLGVFYGIASLGTTFLALLAIPMWLAILVTGSYPRGLRRFALAVLQWSTRVTAWQFLMTDDWRMFGASMKVRIPSIFAAFAFPALMMWWTFLGPQPGDIFGDLFGVGEGMDVVDRFMIEGRDGNTQAAGLLVDPNTFAAADVDRLLATRQLFEGYERAELKGWYRRSSTALGSTLQLQGELLYSSGRNGTFQAFLIKRDGVWLIQGVFIQRPP